MAEPCCNEVLHRIRTQRYPAGSLIPTELQLAAELGCARATVNRAMTELAQRGVVIRRRKVGTRVAAPPLTRCGRCRIPCARGSNRLAGPAVTKCCSAA